MRNIFKELSKKYNLDERDIRVICKEPFRVCRLVMADQFDLKPIMFEYLFKIKLKKKFSIDKSISNKKIKQIEINNNGY